MSEDTLLPQLNDLSLTPKAPKAPKVIYDEVALKERWKILGVDAEQSILSMIRKACMETFARKDFLSTLQAIKSSFVKRDYEGIFTDPVNLAVYSAAYTPGRALCYFEIFSRPKLLKLLSKKTNVLCVGSGSGSELCAIAAAMTRVPQERQAVRLMMQDIGHYEKILESFEGTIRDRFLLTETHLKCEYQQCDMLEEDYNVEEMAKADLITFMFVMNELFVKKAAAMKMIQKLITSMKKGAYLLVVESAGSFSHLKVGNKTYMVYMLLDAIQDLECVIGEDSRWYRHPDHLKYPIDVQNMRYFIRLYRKK